MKTLIAAILITFTINANADFFPLTLLGKTTDGEICSLRIEDWSYTPADQETWEALVLTARSSWQKQENPSLTLKKSQTPWAHHGLNKDTYDQIAINFKTGELSIAGIQSYLFQTYSDDTGLLQKHCRFF